MAAPFAALVGLGNPGPEYADTRHNAGYWLVDRIAARSDCALRAEPKLSALAGRARIEGLEVWLVKPLTFMNESGTTLGALCRYYRLTPEQVLVAHDELDLPPGSARLKKGGGAGGHNGLRDIIARIGADFWRLRIGIGRPPPRRDLIPYVLGRAGKAEREVIDTALERSAEVLPWVLQGDPERAMNLLHRDDGEARHGA